MALSTTHTPAYYDLLGGDLNKTHFEKKQENVEITKNTIQGQIALALKMMKDGKTPVIDISELPHYANNGGITPEQIKESLIIQIKNETFQDISNLSSKAQDEFIAIYNEFQKNNHGVMLRKDNPYWGNILKAVEIKNKITGNIARLEEGKKAIEKAVVQDGIAHGLRGAESKVYRYFKYKLELLKQVDNSLKQVLLEGEREFVNNGKRNSSRFFGILLKFTNKKVMGLRIKNMKEYSPNFYQKLYDNEYLIFKKLNDIIRLKKEVKKGREEVKKGREEVKKGREEVKKGREEVKKGRENNDALKRVLDKIGG